MLTLLFLTSCAAGHKKVPPGWLERRLDTLTLEEKVGQMFAAAYVPRFLNAASPELASLVGMVEEGRIGGIMFFRGLPYEVARSLDRVQQHAEIPLLVMADVEWGPQMRVDQGTRFPPNMAIGATGNEEYEYAIGAMTASEVRAVGVHIGFAPVMDVNNNPLNPIINTRSYGATPELVSKMGAAFIRGMQEHGVYATAKHFPGHGDTQDDSHIKLPAVTASRQRIAEVELPPFRAAVAAGVKCVMVGHIAYPEFPEMQGRPASLDPYFIQHVLRGEMGFDGLVVSDAMDMGGVTGSYWSGEAAVRAINAGVDILLMSPAPEPTFRFVLDAVRSGRIPVARIDASVRRILRAKSDLGLEQRPQLDLQRLEAEVANPDHQRRAAEISDASMTLVRDENGVLPLAAEALDSVLVVAVTDAENGGEVAKLVAGEVGRRVPVVRTAFVDPRSTAEEMRKIIAVADSADAVIAGIFVKWGSAKGKVTLTDTTVALVRQLLGVEKPLAVISFGSPYVLQQIPWTPSYLCAYDATPAAVRSGVRAIFGEIPLQAKLPVDIPGLATLGQGLERAVRPMQLIRQDQAERFSEAFAVLEKAISDSIFPGAQVAVVRDDTLLVSRGLGRQTYDPKSPAVDTRTIYDLASVTKVVATTTCAMRLWEQGRLLLDVPVNTYLPEFRGAGKDSVTLRHLFTHSAGVHWWADLWNQAVNREEALQYIYRLPLDYAPGDSMIYSDLGLILIGRVLETVTGKRVDRLAREMVFAPVGMANTFFNPAAELLPRIAPTEIGGGLNRGLIHGSVHDENAFFFGGVSTHAGLFSTAGDLADFAQMLLNGGIYRHRRLLSPETVRYWTTRQNLPAGSSRALGWDTPSAHGSSAGDYFSAGSFGHTGFTGTSIWIDAQRRIAVILLTNRVHPSRERGGMHQVRRDFHNAVMRALLPGDELSAEKRQ